MAVQDLVALIPPPESPIDADGEWGVAEAEFGVRFPNDFRALIRRYGTGEFKLQGLLVSNPLTEAGRKEVQEQLRTLRELQDACEFPWAIHPDRPGFLPWGG